MTRVVVVSGNSTILPAALILVHALLSSNRCKDLREQGDRLYDLAESPNEISAGRSADEDGDPKETTPLNTTEDDPLESKPNNV